MPMTEYKFEVLQLGEKPYDIVINAYSARDALNEFNREWGSIINGDFTLRVNEIAEVSNLDKPDGEISMRGEWETGIHYYEEDIVKHNRSFWLCKKEHIPSWEDEPGSPGDNQWLLVRLAENKSNQATEANHERA